MIRVPWVVIVAASFALPLAMLSPASLHDAAAQDHGGFAGPLPDTGGIDPKTDPRVLEVTRGLACNCGTCPHEPVNTCTCGTAAKLRADVAAFVSKGQLGEDVVASMVAKHGETILPRPPFQGLALLAYLGPFAAIALVGGWLFFVIRGWTAKARADAAPRHSVSPGEAPDAPTKAKPPSDDPYLSAVDAELSRREGSGGGVGGVPPGSPKGGTIPGGARKRGENR